MTPRGKLKVSMLGWQASTTLWFWLFYFILRYKFDVLNTSTQLFVYWGFYFGFTLYHCVIFGIFNFILPGKDE